MTQSGRISTNLLIRQQDKKQLNDRFNLMTANQLQMVNKSAHKKRLGKNYFRIIGRSCLFIKEEVIANFTPLRKCKKIKSMKSRSILPTFNHDRKYYTIAFRNCSFEPEPDEQTLANHQSRLAESTLQISQIMVPKPRSKQKYCGVCRGHYQEYKDHIESHDHQFFLKQSHYQNLIVKLCKDFQDELEENSKNSPGFQMSSEEIGKQISSISTEEIFQNPMDIKKVEFQENQNNFE